MGRRTPRSYDNELAGKLLSIIRDQLALIPDVHFNAIIPKPTYEQVARYLNPEDDAVQGLVSDLISIVSCQLAVEWAAKVRSDAATKPQADKGYPSLTADYNARQSSTSTSNDGQPSRRSFAPRLPSSSFYAREALFGTGDDTSADDESEFSVNDAVHQEVARLRAQSASARYHRRRNVVGTAERMFSLADDIAEDRREAVWLSQLELSPSDPPTSINPAARLGGQVEIGSPSFPLPGDTIMGDAEDQVGNLDHVGNDTHGQDAGTEVNGAPENAINAVIPSTFEGGVIANQASSVTQQSSNPPILSLMQSQTDPSAVQPTPLFPVLAASPDSTFPTEAQWRELLRNYRDISNPNVELIREMESSLSLATQMSIQQARILGIMRNDSERIVTDRLERDEERGLAAHRRMADIAEIDEGPEVTNHWSGEVTARHAPSLARRLDSLLRGRPLPAHVLGAAGLMRIDSYHTYCLLDDLVERYIAQDPNATEGFAIARSRLWTEYTTGYLARDQRRLGIYMDKEGVEHLDEWENTCEDDGEDGGDGAEVDPGNAENEGEEEVEDDGDENGTRDDRLAAGFSGFVSGSAIARNESRVERELEDTAGTSTVDRALPSVAHSVPGPTILRVNPTDFTVRFPVEIDSDARFTERVAASDQTATTVLNHLGETIGELMDCIEDSAQNGEIIPARAEEIEGLVEDFVEPTEAMIRETIESTIAEDVERNTALRVRARLALAEGMTFEEEEIWTNWETITATLKATIDNFSRAMKEHHQRALIENRVLPPAVEDRINQSTEPVSRDERLIAPLPSASRHNRQLEEQARQMLTATRRTRDAARDLLARNENSAGVVDDTEVTAAGLPRGS